jgi:uncharacterized membrane protein
MATCPKCGSTVTDGTKFCAACGAPIGAAPNSGASAPPPPSPLGQPPAATPGGLTPNVAAMLTYLPICLIGLVCAILFAFILEPYKSNRFIRFHAWQSIALHVAYIIFLIGWTIFSMILVAMLHVIGLLTSLVSMLVGLGVLVLAVFLMVKAYGNESFKLPIIGAWADKQAGS